MPVMPGQVTEVDPVVPTALCQNVSVQLDTSGNGSTSAATIDNGSNDGSCHDPFFLLKFNEKVYLTEGPIQSLAKNLFSPHSGLQNFVAAGITNGWGVN